VSRDRRRQWRATAVTEVTEGQRPYAHCGERTRLQLAWWQSCSITKRGTPAVNYFLGNRSSPQKKKEGSAQFAGRERRGIRRRGGCLFFVPCCCLRGRITWRMSCLCGKLDSDPHPEELRPGVRWLTRNFFCWQTGHQRRLYRVSRMPRRAVARRCPREISWGGAFGTWGPPSFA